MNQFLTSGIHLMLEPWYLAIATAFFWVLVYFFYKRIALMFFRTVTEYMDFNLGNAILDACESHIDRLIGLIGFYFVLKQLPFAWTQDLSFIRSLFGSIGWGFVFCCCFKAVVIVKPVVANALRNAGITASDTLAGIFSGIIRIVIAMMCIGLIAREWQFDIIGFMASVSVVSVAVAYAGKDALANIFGGIIIIVDKSFMIGDWVKINSVEGIVEKITFRSTYIRAFPQEQIVVPNNLLINTPIINYTKRGKRRIDMTMGLTYDTTREQMEDFLEAVRTYLQNNPKIEKDDIRVNFVTYNDSSLDVDIVCYVGKDYIATADYLNVVSEINLALMDIMDKCKVSCAFPTRSIYLENVNK